MVETGTHDFNGWGFRNLWSRIVKTQIGAMKGKVSPHVLILPFLLFIADALGFFFVSGDRYYSDGSRGVDGHSSKHQQFDGAVLMNDDVTEVSYLPANR